MQKQISDLLSKEGIWFISTVEYHEVLSSTNDRVKILFETIASNKLPCLVLTKRQTAGRGRGNKVWWSGQGALLMSLGLELSAFSLTRSDLPLLSLATGLSVCQGLEKFLPRSHEVRLHWPNDVYVDGRKICGILIESPKPNQAAIGIGININNRLSSISEEFRQEFEKNPITTMFDILGKKTDILSILVAFLRKFQYNVEKGIASNYVIHEAEACCIQIGRKISVRQNDRDIQGYCLGIAPDASLIVQTEHGTEKILCGIVQ